MERYFILYLAYDGSGHCTLDNEVVLRRAPLQSKAEIDRLEDDLAAGFAAGGHVRLLHFISLGREGQDKAPRPPRQTW